MSRIVTHFPLDLPRLPGVGHVVKQLINSSAGRQIEMTIDGVALAATIISIEQVKGGFNITTEIED